jgi:carbonic anhydrase/acetyltransferase-like protein (isoleucine patch superfamily)
MDTIIHKIRVFFISILNAFIQFLPEEFSSVRIWFFNKNGLSISRKARIHPLVTMRGKVIIGDESRIDKMCYILGDYEGGRFGSNVSIGPNCRIQ